MNIRPEVRQNWPRKLQKVVFLGVIAVALSITLAACTNSSSSTPSAHSSKGSGSASIDVSGKVVAHYTGHCLLGSDSTPNQVTMAFTGVGKVSGRPLTLVVYAPKNSVSSTYPASSTAAAVTLATTSGSSYSWANSSGTLTVSGGGSAGTLDLTMAPSNQATGTVHVQGSWTGCASD
jgi:hypothetical protein